MRRNLFLIILLFTLLFMGCEQANKHFFRRDSWKITYKGDDIEHYLFVLTKKDLKKE